VRLVVILLLTVLLMPIILPLIAEENLARVGGAYLLALVVSGLVVFLAARLLKLIDRIPVVKQINRLGGAVFGFCIGVVLVFLALTVIDAFQNVPWCCEVSACAKQSEILRPLISYIPDVSNMVNHK
jgi:uncharacterized membrane protein required for colicin V production